MVTPAISLLAAFGLTFVACLVIVATKRHHGHLSLDSTLGVQKFHHSPTPRVGGVAIVLGCFGAVPVVDTQLQVLLLPILLAGLPAFMIGIAEDLTKRVPVRTRLLFTIVSGVLAWWLTGVSLTRVNVYGLDWVLAFLPLSVLFTAFAVSGAANAFNIIDGFNGLASGVALIALTALGAIAYRVDDLPIAQVCAVIGAVTVGFMLVNFPLGKIFLGDGGAYFLGFLVAWLAVMLPMRNADVSVWASLLACGYPILETAFSIVRKMRRQGHHPGQPDRVHLHMLLYKRVSRRVVGHGIRAFQNSATSPLVWLFAAFPALCSAIWPSETLALALAFGFTAITYWGIYFRLTRFRWCFLRGKSSGGR